MVHTIRSNLSKNLVDMCATLSMAHSFILSLSLRSKQHFYSFCSPSAFTYTTYYVKTARMKAFKNVPWLLLLQLITTSSKLVGGRIPSDSSSYVTLSQSWIDEELREYLKHPLSFPPTSGPVSQKPELVSDKPQSEKQSQQLSAPPFHASNATPGGHPHQTPSRHL